MNESEKHSFKNFWRRFQHSAIYKIARFITNSAAIALLITAILFVYQEHEERTRTERIITNLQDISEDMLSVQKSISTRYLGIFPSYIQVVNELFRTCAPTDSIIVFEDVLYYGFISRPKEFIQMSQLLLSHADAGGSVTIVYYDEDDRTFHRMVSEELISSSYYAAMAQDRKQLELSSNKSFDQLQSMDSTLCNKYFSLSQEKDPFSYESRALRTFQSLLKPVCEEEDVMPDVVSLCEKIDSIRSSILDHKSINTIGFFDYEDMDRSVTKEIASVYRSHGIDLCLLDEYLTMSCWLAGENAVLAFPSKWSSDEIGFYSQDPAFARYISTMLMGVRSMTNEYPPPSFLPTEDVPCNPPKKNQAYNCPGHD